MTVPILNQPVTLMTWYPTALLSCNCVEPGKLNIIIITGLNNTVQCNNCGKGYMVKSVKPDGTLDVAIIFPAPKPPRVQ